MNLNKRLGQLEVSEVSNSLQYGSGHKQMIVGHEEAAQAIRDDLNSLLPEEKWDKDFGLSTYDGDDISMNTPSLSDHDEGYNKAIADVRQALNEYTGEV